MKLTTIALFNSKMNLSLKLKIITDRFLVIKNQYNGYEYFFHNNDGYKYFFHYKRPLMQINKMLILAIKNKNVYF